MSPVYCICGQRLETAIAEDGLAYCITFRVPDEQAHGHWPVTHCPNCDRHLGQALITGQLHERSLPTTTSQRG